MKLDAIAGTRVLVTGGAGFIGTNLTRALLDQEAEVVVLDNLCNGLRSNLPSAPRLHFLEGNILDEAAVEEACRGCDAVFHQAAIGSVPRSIKQPLIYYDNNVKGTAVVFEAARAAGVRRVVWASSSSVYGNTDVPEKTEGEEGTPISPYAASKAAAEIVARAHAAAFGQQIVGLRYFNVYGPYQRPDSDYAAVVPLFMACLLDGVRPRIFGDGEQRRDFSFVQDVVAANLAAAYSPRPFAGEVVNISGGHAYSVNQLLAAAAKAAGVEAPEPEYVARRAGDVLRSKANLTRAATLLDYKPAVDIDAGLRRTVEWFRGGRTGSDTTTAAGAS